jgi:hypothetical protein
VDVPPKMKVKGYMYPQMKKPVGMPFNHCYFIAWSIIKQFYLLFKGMKAFDFGCAWYNNRASYLTFSSSSYKAALNMASAAC